MTAQEALNRAAYYLGRAFSARQRAYPYSTPEERECLRQHQLWMDRCRELRRREHAELFSQTAAAGGKNKR